MRVEIERIVIAPPASCHCPGVIAALHKFPNVIGPNGGSSFIRCHPRRLAEMLLNFFLCGAVRRRYQIASLIGQKQDTAGRNDGQGEYQRVDKDPYRQTCPARQHWSDENSPHAGPHGPIVAAVHDGIASV